MKLHLGCGGIHLDGFVNIDIHRTRASDKTLDVTQPLPYAPGSIERIETYHLIEHLPWKQVPEVLSNWHYVLKPGGVLVLECPDFDAHIKAYLAGDDPEKQLRCIFGLQRVAYDVHLWGYNGDRLIRMLLDAGFQDAKQREAQDYHALEGPCIRVEAIA